MKDLEISQNICIKRLLKIPLTTPNAILRGELGIWSVEAQILYKKLMFLQRILKQDKTIAKLVLLEQQNLPGPTWLHELKQLMITIGLNQTLEEIQKLSKFKWKRIIKNYIASKELSTLMKTKETAQKGKKLEANISCKKYLSTLDLDEAHTILLIRTGMVDVKANYKQQQQDLNCPICNEEVETSTHMLTCNKYSSNPLDESIIKLIWSSGCSHEQIRAMSLAAKAYKTKHSERDMQTANCARLQDDEEGASISAMLRTI